MSDKTYKAVKYLRLSVIGERHDESESISNQRKIIDAFLIEHPEIECISERVDDGESGIVFDRPAFNEMMFDIENGKVNCVITKEFP